jgi:hypothetical protein
VHFIIDIAILVLCVYFFVLSSYFLTFESTLYARVELSQEEMSMFWEVTVSVILNKKVYMYTCPIPNGFRDRDISLYSSLVKTSNTPCPHTRVAKRIAVDG